MSNKIKWAIAILAVFGIVVIAQASALTNYYLPIAAYEPTLTPTPTECLKQYFPVSGVKVCFTDIVYKPTTSKYDEWVSIKNLGNTAVDMEGWRITSDSSSYKYDLPAFTLSSGQTVKVFTKFGVDTTNQLYMNRPNSFWDETNGHGFWKDNGDVGYLKDENRALINYFCYGTACSFVTIDLEELD